MAYRCQTVRTPVVDGRGRRGHVDYALAYDGPGRDPIVYRKTPRGLRRVKDRQELDHVFAQVEVDRQRRERAAAEERAAREYVAALDAWKAGGEQGPPPPRPGAEPEPTTTEEATHG